MRRIDKRTDVRYNVGVDKESGNMNRDRREYINAEKNKYINAIIGMLNTMSLDKVMYTYRQVTRIFKK